MRVRTTGQRLGEEPRPWKTVYEGDERAPTSKRRGRKERAEPEPEPETEPTDPIEEVDTDA